MKQRILNHLKNIPGWKTKRKIVVFSVDDYGNVRLDSRKARAALDSAGLKCFTRFDALDTLETSEDLEQLFDVLRSVKDLNNRNFVFTPFSLSCNIDFETMAEEGNQIYRYEELPQTFSKLEGLQPKAYKNTWALWKEGISDKLLSPQFHGREHINVKIFENKLRKRDKEVLINLQNRSYTSISNSEYLNMSYTAAFSFENEEDIKNFGEIMKSGVESFSNVFGISPSVFTPPATQFPIDMEPELNSFGMKFLDKPFQISRHLGYGKYKRQFNFLGPDRKNNLIILVRNVVFEPTDDRGFDWVNFTLKQIEAAFFWNKPAIISSHRVNFCGHIDPKNREMGLSDLKQLLKKIVQKWPEVEFMSADELGKIILDNS